MMSSYAALLLLSAFIASGRLSADVYAFALSRNEELQQEENPSLVPMVLPDGGTFYAYVEPKHCNFYRNREMQEEATPSSYKPSSKKLVEVWNLSTINLDMLDRGAVEPATSRSSFQIRSSDRAVGPVDNLSQVFALGSPGQVICLKKTSKNECLTEFTVAEGGPLVFDCNKDYSAMTDYGREPECGGLHKFLPHELSKYYKIVNHLKFKYGYRRLTGRNYLAGDPRAVTEDTNTPRTMWPADYFGQKHDAVITVQRLEGDLNQGDNVVEKTTLTLKALSGSPRVFQIHSFLSEDEISHIMEAAREEFHEDKMGGQRAVLHRPTSSVIETICSRASDALQVNDSMASKHFDSIVVERTTAKSVDFDTASHDNSEIGVKVIPKSVFMRYATLVLFLNEPYVGGELTFPLSGEHSTSTHPLVINPKKGSAILFYSVLPDGNLDERSIWELAPVVRGDRWVATLTIAEDMDFY